MTGRGRRRSSGFLGLLRRNLPLLVVGALLGGLLGWMVASLRSDYTASTVVSVRAGTGDAAATNTAVQSAAVIATSDAVITQAAGALGVDPGNLKRRTTATVDDGTTLVTISVTASTDAEAARAAAAVADAAVNSYRTRSSEIASQVRTAGEELLASGKLSASAAEIARQNSIGLTVGQAQGGSIDGAVALTLVSPPTQARLAGISKSIGFIFGAAAGVLLAALLALSRGWQRRRRIRNEADLQSARGSRLAVTDDSVDQIAGVILESGQRCVVVLDAGAPAGPADAFEHALADALVRQGDTVGRVVIGAQADLVPAGAPGPVRTARWEEADSLLSRASREKLPAELGCDIVLVAVPVDVPATVLLHGQRNYVPVVLVGSGSRLGDVEAALAPLADAGPIAVLVG